MNSIKSLMGMIATEAAEMTQPSTQRTKMSDCKTPKEYAATLEALEIINSLGKTRVNGKPVYYELECGVDYRFLTAEIAGQLYNHRFGNFVRGKWNRNMKIAWDWGYDQFRGLYDAKNVLQAAGYKSGEISVFMICNWRIPLKECLRKLQVLGIWRVLVNDCYWDNQTFPEVKPEYWAWNELKYFRYLCRAHNMLVRFDGYDPSLKKTISTIRRTKMPRIINCNKVLQITIPRGPKPLNCAIGSKQA